MKKLKLNVTYYKILSTIYELNKLGFYPINEGVYKIVTGQKDDETLQFVNLPTYSTLISYTSKKICNLTLMLFRYKFLSKVFDRETNELYFKITQLGIDSLNLYLKGKKNPFSKKEILKKATIIKINK